MALHDPVTLDKDMQKRVDQQRATVDEAYEAYKELRGKCPVARSEVGGGYYLLTRHADVLRAAMDWKSFSSAGGVNFPPDRTRPPLPCIEQDPPDHAHWRKLYADAVTPQAVDGMRPHVQDIADRLIDKFAADGSVDLVSQFANPLPILGITSAIGLTDKRPEDVHELAVALSSSVNDPAAQRVAIGRLTEFIMDQVTARRQSPRDDYMTTIAQIEVDGHLMEGQFLGMFMTGFLVAGHETTSAAFSNLMFHVLRDSTLRRRVMEDDKALAAAVEEAVRLTAPFHAFSRTTTKEVEIGGYTIPEDQIVRLNWAAANRDPAVYANPDAFDIDRPSNPHLGFGSGRHVCAGAGFARMEMSVALRRLLTRLPDIEVVQDRLDWNFIGGMMTIPGALNATFSPDR
jgi:cytochrome P450